MAFWQLGNQYAAEAAHAGRRVVRVNLDESSVSLFYDPELGVIVKRPRDDQEPPPRFNVSRGIRRTNFTYVGFLADDATLQRHLPHVIIGLAGLDFVPEQPSC